ncbi:hypothetical protein [Streptomyces sp. 135]|uniref:hypothetical protein n=1 Tax=Streptomyces sp. 135 TaxID=2838850 RepID=UPI001CBAABB1|nr:hypothetical protein [Streptomyces sp. 135]
MLLSAPARAVADDVDALAGRPSGFVHVQQQRLSMGFDSRRRSTRSEMFTGNDGTVVGEGVRAGR